MRKGLTALMVATGLIGTLWAADKTIVENQYLTVLDVTVPSGGSIAPNPGHDALLIYLTDARDAKSAIGEVVFVAKNKAQPQGVAGPGGMHLIEIALNEVPMMHYQNKTKYPSAMPRPGAKKLLENNRLTAWDYTWPPGESTLMHFHDKDVVVTYLAKGVLKSTALDGSVSMNPHYFGFSKFNPGNRTHTETLAEGEGRAIIVELK